MFCEALSYAATVNHGYRTRNVQNILLLLFGVKVFASYGCTFNGIKCGEHLIPKRHQSHFDKLDISCAQLVQLVTSYYCPDTVRIDLAKFLSSDFFAHQSSLSTLKRAVGPLFYQPLHAPRYYNEGALNTLPHGGLKCLDMYASDSTPLDINEFAESTQEN